MSDEPKMVDKLLGIWCTENGGFWISDVGVEDPEVAERKARILSSPDQPGLFRAAVRCRSGPTDAQIREIVTEAIEFWTTRTSCTGDDARQHVLDWWHSRQQQEGDPR
jgi:hypothetical protein